MPRRRPRVRPVKLPISDPIERHGASPSADHRRQDEQKDPPPRPATIIPRRHRHGGQSEREGENSMGELDEFEPFPQILKQRAHPPPIQACKSAPVNTNAAMGANQTLSATGSAKTFAKDEALKSILDIVLLETRAELLLAVALAPNVSTNVFLRRLRPIGYSAKKSETTPRNPRNVRYIV